eukprot:186715-Pleurochrysis_carterae.AAC.1
MKLNEKWLREARSSWRHTRFPRVPIPACTIVALLLGRPASLPPYLHVIFTYSHPGRSTVTEFPPIRHLLTCFAHLRPQVPFFKGLRMINDADPSNPIQLVKPVESEFMAQVRSLPQYPPHNHKHKHTPRQKDTHLDTKAHTLTQRHIPRHKGTHLDTKAHT